METKLLVESCSSIFLCFVKIHNWPFLVASTSVVLDSNLLSFNVLWISYIKNLIVGPVDELVILELE
jgi:hypothetical protein